MDWTGAKFRQGPRMTAGGAAPVTPDVVIGAAGAPRYCLAVPCAGAVAHLGAPQGSALWGLCQSAGGREPDRPLPPPAHPA